ncbi:MAG: hypothetical protein RR060_03680, partial [Victivallaceae bacterium]
MNIALNIGNTHTQIATCDGNEIRQINTISSIDLTPEHLTGAEQIAAACVVPLIRQRLSVHEPIFWVDNQHCGELVFHDVDP